MPPKRRINMIMIESLTINTTLLYNNERRDKDSNPDKYLTNPYNIATFYFINTIFLVSTKEPVCNL
jgi:hypothetical protein